MGGSLRSNSAISLVRRAFFQLLSETTDIIIKFGHVAAFASSMPRKNFGVSREARN